MVLLLLFLSVVLIIILVRKGHTRSDEKTRPKTDTLVNGSKPDKSGDEDIDNLHFEVNEAYGAAAFFTQENIAYTTARTISSSDYEDLTYMYVEYI